MYCPNCRNEIESAEPLAQLGQVGYCEHCHTRFVVFHQLTNQQRYSDLMDYDNGCDGE